MLLPVRVGIVGSAVIVYPDPGAAVVGGGLCCPKINELKLKTEMADVISDELTDAYTSL